MVEKEFHVGRIDDEFPALKFWNLFDEYNLNKYKESFEKDLPTKAKTMR